MRMFAEYFFRVENMMKGMMVPLQLNIQLVVTLHRVNFGKADLEVIKYCGLYLKVIRRL